MQKGILVITLKNSEQNIASLFIIKTKANKSKTFLLEPKHGLFVYLAFYCYLLYLVSVEMTFFHCTWRLIARCRTKIILSGTRIIKSYRREADPISEGTIQVAFAISFGGVFF